MSAGENQGYGLLSPVGVAKSFVRLGLYACRRGGTFAPPRRTQPPLQSGRPSVALRAALSAAVRPPLPTRSCDLAGTPNSKSGLGQAPRPRRTGTPARNGCAVPKRGLNGAYREPAAHFYRLPRWCAEWRTTTPVPSSEEGNDGGSEQIPSGLLPQVFTAIMACR